MADMGCELSLEQVERCDLYVQNLRKWQKHINLVGPATLSQVYTRHILDAAQLINEVPRGTVLDVGSGAGIPGLIWRIFLDNRIYLCERVGKKTSFLKDTIRKLDIEDNCKVIGTDVADINQTFDIITARAVTKIDEFLALTRHCAQKTTLYILPKGKDYQSELDAALRNWNFDCRIQSSLVDASSKILFLSGISKR